MLLEFLLMLMVEGKKKKELLWAWWPIMKFK